MDEKTRVSLSVVTFFTLILFMISTVYAATTWKTQMENTDKNILSRIESFDNRIEVVETATIEQQTTLAEIQTDLKWIRAYMEDNR